MKNENRTSTGVYFAGKPLTWKELYQWFSEWQKQGERKDGWPNQEES